MLAIFCPGTCPPVKEKYTYTVEQTDTKSDGWQGVYFALRQNGTVQYFGKNFTKGGKNTEKLTFNRFPWV